MERSVTANGAARPRRWSVKRIVFVVAAAPFIAVFGVLLFFILLLVLLGHFLQALFMAAGVFLFHRAFVEYRNELTVRNLPTAKVSSAAVGLVELVGRGRSESPTPAPISGKLSAYWTVALEEYYSGKDSGWRGVARRESPATLQLEDDTGRMLIWSTGAEFALESTTWNSHDGPPPDGGTRFLAEVGKQWPDKSRSPMRIIETRIEDGGPLYVLGTLSERRQIPAKFERPAQAAVAAPAGASTSATPSVFVKMAEHYGVQADSLYPPDIEPGRLLVWRGAEKRPFVIASSEQQALKTLSSSIRWELGVGAALIAIALITYLVGR